MQVEEWRSITEWPGYEVSSLGRIRRDGHIKKPFPDRKGYLKVKLWRLSKAKNLLVHRLVAEHFIGPAPVDQVCRHLNGDKTDNNPSNLAYGTRAQNEADKIKHGTALAGEGHHQSKLTDVQVASIRSRYKRGCPANGGRALAREFGISDVQEANIARRKHWSHA